MLKKVIYKYSIFVFILLLLLFIKMSGISLSEIIVPLKKLRWSDIAILITWFLFISFVSISGKRLLLYFLGYSTKLKNIVLIHFASASAHYSTPVKIGYPVTVFLLKKLEGIPIASSSALIMIELLVSLFVTSTITLCGIFLYFIDRLPSFSTGVLMLFTALLIFVFIFYLLYTKVKQIRNMFHEFYQALQYMNLSKTLIFIFIQLIQLTLGAGYMQFIVSLLGEDISLWHAMVSNSSAFFLGAISMVPMGLGTRDLTLIFYLKSFGVQPHIALSIAAIQRVTSTGLSYFLGLISLSYLGLKGVKLEK